MTSAKVSLARVFTKLTEEEAKAVYDGLAQWLDNVRNSIDEDEPRTDSNRKAHEALVRNVALVDGVVSRLDAEMCRLAEAVVEAV